MAACVLVQSHVAAEGGPATNSQPAVALTWQKETF